MYIKICHHFLYLRENGGRTVGYPVYEYRRDVGRPTDFEAIMQDINAGVKNSLSNLDTLVLCRCLVKKRCFRKGLCFMVRIMTFILKKGSKG